MDEDDCKDLGRD